MGVERATSYEGFNLGKETTSGTAVAATLKLLGIQFDVENMTDITPQKTQGLKFVSAATEGKEMTELKLSGYMSYYDLPYLLAMCMSQTGPTTPANNSTWLVTGATGTFGVTFNSATLAPVAIANAAALQTALEGLSTIGTGNVVVTNTDATPGNYTVKFAAALSTSTLAFTSPTGTPTTTIAAQATATATRRWTFYLVPDGVDTITTFTGEKGAKNISGFAQQIPYLFLAGLQFKINKKDNTLTGDGFGQITVDPFTMSDPITYNKMIPVDPKNANTWIGEHLISTSNGMRKLRRCLEWEFGMTGKANGLMTLDADVSSFSTPIELDPETTVKVTAMHNSEGQAILAELRANTPVYVIYENCGPLIEAGFPHRVKITAYTSLTKVGTGDTDGAVTKAYDGSVRLDAGMGTGFKIEIDNALTAL